MPTGPASSRVFSPRAVGHRNTAPHFLWRRNVGFDARRCRTQSARGAPLDLQTAQQLLAARGLVHTPTFAAVLAAVHAPRSLALATLWRLIARGALHVDLSAPIGLDTILSLP